MVDGHSAPSLYESSNANGRLRDECLNEHLFANLRQARQIVEEWRIDYNTNRPRTSLDGLTPTEFAARPMEWHNWKRFSL
jgi:putative transposase